MGKGLSLSANEKAVVGRLVKVEGQAGEKSVLVKTLCQLASSQDHLGSGNFT